MRGKARNQRPAGPFAGRGISPALFVALLAGNRRKKAAGATSPERTRGLAGSFAATARDRQGRLQYAENQSQPGFRRTDRGIGQVEDRIWRVSFMHGGVGYFDDETLRLARLEKPFRAKSAAYVSGISRYPCVRNGPDVNGAPEEFRTPDPQIRGL